MSRLDVLDEGLARLSAERTLRARRTVESAQGPRLRVDGRDVLHFGSNDYLGLAADPAVCEAARSAIARYGVGSGASHLISGHFAPHAQLERELAEFAGRFCGSPAALCFSTGYMANLGIVTALMGRDDEIFADKLNHACLNDAALLSRARFTRYPHGDVAALERRLAASASSNKLIATDGVFSMDGDLAPLPRLLELAERYDAWLLVDDAHGFGVLGEGRGVVEHFRGRWKGGATDRLLYMGTLGKAAGVAGAFVCGHSTVIEWLLQKARTYIFTTATPPALAAALLASLELMREDAPRRERLLALVDMLRTKMVSAIAGTQWRLLDSPSAIQALVIGDNAATLALSEALWKRGIWVPAIRPPTVPAGSSRLRITLSAAHSPGDIECLLTALRDIARGERERSE
jgi:8-amino-7-oxononanoate synthase